MRINWLEVPGAVRRYFQDLFSGDLVAWTLTLVILGVFLLFCLFWRKVSRDLRREDEKRKRRWHGKTVAQEDR